MKLYTADGYSYDGMSQALVTTLRTALGLSTTFVDEATYDTFVAAQQPRN